jgi:hypothetical protein
MAKHSIQPPSVMEAGMASLLLAAGWPQVRHGLVTSQPCSWKRASTSRSRGRSGRARPCSVPRVDVDGVLVEGHAQAGTQTMLSTGSWPAQPGHSRRSPRSRKWRCGFHHPCTRQAAGRSPIRGDGVLLLDLRQPPGS